MKLVIYGILLIVSSIIQAQNSSSKDKEWADFKAKFNKIYGSAEEEAIARQYFEQNNKPIQEQTLGKGGSKSYLMGLNEHCDMSYIEFLRQKTGAIKPDEKQNLTVAQNSVNILLKVKRQTPTSVDYRTNKCNSLIKNQGRCGSCWAFATVGVVEYQFCKKYNILTDMSEQNLIDCTYSYCGCAGGNFHVSYPYILNSGVTVETSYTNYANTSGACTSLKCTTSPKIFVNTVYYVSNNEVSMAFVVANYGPISVYVFASADFMTYKNGIFNDPKCTSEINHAVIIVGYGIDSATNTPYWIIKNSWGPTWGMSGYMFMKRGVNQCNIAKYSPYFALF